MADSDSLNEEYLSNTIRGIVNPGGGTRFGGGNPPPPELVDYLRSHYWLHDQTSTCFVTTFTMDQGLQTEQLLH